MRRILLRVRCRQPIGLTVSNGEGLIMPKVGGKKFPYTAAGKAAAARARRESRSGAALRQAGAAPKKKKAAKKKK